MSDRKPNKDKWYTVVEAADLLGVGVDTVKKYCREKYSRENPPRAKHVGPRRNWTIQGSAIISQREEWNIAETEP